ncbi:hypothetical protein [Streptomyces virginiae]|uniref:hypothetical protein n=1 Tax=Streptomyces virginiae TaxID=1961 RepID=UPI00364EC733
MTSTPPRSVLLAARVTTLLAETFPEYVPGAQDGFRVLSPDAQEPRRMCVRWYGNARGSIFGRGPAAGVGQYSAALAKALEDAGYAVTQPPGGWDVHVADRPHDEEAPRYAAVANDIPFTAPWLVMDTWTRVHRATADSEARAGFVAGLLNRFMVLVDARKAVSADLAPFLEPADKLLGDGLCWLRREVHDSREYSELVQHGRLDALVDVANALRRGDEVVQEGRRAAYATAYPARAHWPLTYRVEWVPKATAPAVGYFPHPEWQRGPAEDAAIALLVEAGVRPVFYGESVGGSGFLCEQDGFMVSAVDPADLSVPGVNIGTIGRSAQVDRVPEVLRAAGWRIEGDEHDWTAFPPAAG